MHCSRFFSAGVKSFLLAVAVHLAGQPADAAVLRPYAAEVNTLHLWHFDEPAVPVGDDAFGGTNLNYLIGGAMLGNASATNSFTNCISFGTLTTSNAVIFPAGSGFVGATNVFTCAGSDGAFTFEALVQIGFNPVGFVRAQPCQILNCDGNNNNYGTRVFQFRLDPVGFGGGDTNVCRLEFINGTTTVALAPIPTNGPDAIVSNSWYHVAVTYNGSANTASNLLFYWTLLDTNRAAASCIYGTNMTSDLPGVSGNSTIFSIGNGARNPGGGTGPAQANFLGKMDEVRISSVARGTNEFVFQAVSVLAASSYEAGSTNYPQNILDGNLNSRWSAQGDGQWVTLDLGRVQLVQSIDLAFYQPAGVRTNWFDVLLSNDALVWRNALTNAAGTNTALANFDFTDWPARYVRIVGHGNSVNNFNSLTEAVIHSSVPADADRDGLPDVWENYYFSSLTNVPTGDPDGDLMANAYEFLHGTDPSLFSASGDNDGDGLDDAWEMTQLGTLAYGAYDDPDGDGYNNLAELFAGTLPGDNTSKPAWLAPRVAFLRDSVVATNACLMPGTATYGRAINGISFQKDNILLTFGGYQYTAWYDTVDTVQTVWLARRGVTNTSVGAWEKFNTGSEFINGDESSWDAHNVIAIGICPADGTLHLSWDHHNNTLRYRRSVAGLCTTNKAAWGAGMLNAEQDWLVASGQTELDVTYPQFITTPDGGLVLDRRMGVSGNGDQYFQVYNPATGAWSAKVQFINRAGTYVGPDAFGTTRTCTERCAYVNGLDFGPDGSMHVTWTWRESASQYGNRDICYAYSPDLGTNWYNNAGTKIADTSQAQKITQASSGITIELLDMRQLLINQQAQCVDGDGRVHVLMLHRRQDPGFEPAVFSKQFSTKFTAYYHYFRDPATGDWAQRRIPVEDYPVGSRPKIGYDAGGNVYAVFVSYPGGTDVTPGYTNGKLIVASASKASQYTDWEIMQVVDVAFDGEPLLDQRRLLVDNLLSVFLQEHSTTTSVVGTPLHVFDFAVNVTPPSATATNTIAMNFIGPDSLVTVGATAGHTYQLQAATTLSPANWTDIGPAVSGVNGLLALPDPDGRGANQKFYRVVTDP